MNKIQKIALALLAASVLALSAAAAAGPERGLLWRIEHNGTTVGHLFGTIHSDRADVLDLPPPVERVFRSAERYAFEVDGRKVDPREVARVMRYQDGGSLPEHLPEPLWQRIQRIAKQRGLPPQAIAGLEPWALALALSLPPTDPEQMLDLVLQRRAQAFGRPVTGLETVSEQLSIFDRLAPDHQIEMLTRVVELVENDRMKTYFERMVRAWQQRDLARIVELSEADPALADPAASEQLMTQLLDRRNERMIERMQPHLDAGGAFVAIGALHLTGDNGLVRKLEQRGYTLSPVY